MKEVRRWKDTDKNPVDNKNENFKDGFKTGWNHCLDAVTKNSTDAGKEIEKKPEPGDWDE